MGRVVRNKGMKGKGDMEEKNDGEMFRVGSEVLGKSGREAVTGEGGVKLTVEAA